MTDTTVIRNATWIIAWDGNAGTHTYIKDADLVFTGNRIAFVGHGYSGAFDQEIANVEETAWNSVVAFIGG